jgi:hypothetical protein
VLALDTNQPTRMAPAVDRWLTAIRTGAAMLEERIIGPLLLPYAHDGDEFTTRQVKATRLRKVRLAEGEDDRTMYLLDKDGQIGNDATVADVLAHEAVVAIVGLTMIVVAIAAFDWRLGLLVPWGIDISMAAGAVAMSLSTIIVAVNAQLLRRMKLRPEPAESDAVLSLA